MLYIDPLLCEFLDLATWGGDIGRNPVSPPERPLHLQFYVHSPFCRSGTLRILV